MVPLLCATVATTNINMSELHPCTSTCYCYQLALEASHNRPCFANPLHCTTRRACTSYEPSYIQLLFVMSGYSTLYLLTRNIKNKYMRLFSVYFLRLVLDWRGFTKVRPSFYELGFGNFAKKKFVILLWVYFT